MRIFTAVILLASFVIVQYAKQVSYLECVLSNSFKAASQRCDCEKLLSKDSATNDQSPFPASHTHIHPDESYFPSPSFREIYFFTARLTPIAALTTKPVDVIIAGPEHPPQF